MSAPFSIFSFLDFIVQMLVCLMLSQKSLKWYSLKNKTKHFSFLFSLGDFYYSFILLICYSISANWLWITSNVFFTLGIVFFSYDCLFLYFVIFAKVLTVFIYYSPEISEHLYDHYLELFMDRLSSLCLVLSLRFCFIPLFGTYSSVSSFCLILCVYFCIEGSFVTCPKLREVAVWRRPVVTSSTAPPGQQY